MNASIYFRCSSLVRNHSLLFPCSCWLSIFEEEIKLIIGKMNSARASKPSLTEKMKALSILSLSGVAYFHQGPPGFRLGKTEEAYA